MDADARIFIATHEENLALVIQEICKTVRVTAHFTSSSNATGWSHDITMNCDARQWGRIRRAARMRHFCQMQGIDSRELDYAVHYIAWVEYCASFTDDLLWPPEPLPGPQ